MNIAIDVVPIRNNGEIGGAFQTVLELIKGLANFNSEDNYFLLTAEWNHEFFSMFDELGVKRILVQTSSVDNSVKNSKINRYIQKFVAKYPFVNKLIRKAKDVTSAKINILNNHNIHVLFCPMSAVQYADPDIPVVSLIHDLQHIYYPQFFTEDEINHRNQFYENIKEKADHIICVSEFTRKTVLNSLQILQERTHVIYTSIQLRNGDLSVDEIDLVLKRFNLYKKRYLFYPANLWEHKNHKILLNAISIYINQHSEQEIYLCLSGSLLNKKQDFDATLRKMKLADRVQHLGYVSDREVAIIMSKAEALIFPSLFEGFGIPVAEAMAAGVPVLCSNGSSLPEVAGNAALYFDPRKPLDIASCLYRLLNDSALRERMISLGYEQIKRFNDVKMIQEYYSVLLQASQTIPSENYHIKGVYEDGWSGNNIHIFIAKENFGQLLCAEFSMPDFIPLKRNSLTLFLNKEKVKYEILNGSNLLIEKNLPSNIRSFVITLKSTFSPINIGIEDHRLLGLQVKKIEIRNKIDKSLVKTLV